MCCDYFLILLSGVIDLYKSMLAKRRLGLSRAIDRLQSGLEKLQKTARDVAILEEDLKVKSVEVEEKKESADAFAEQVLIIIVVIITIHRVRFMVN